VRVGARSRGEEAERRRRRKSRRTKGGAEAERRRRCSRVTEDTQTAVQRSGVHREKGRSTARATAMNGGAAWTECAGVWAGVRRGARA
jgi:hypothetical protein